MSAPDFVAREALKKHGAKRQLKKLAEELSELSVEVLHMENDKGDLNKLVDEFADVRFMMYQIELWMDSQTNDAFTDLVDLAYQYKVDRTEIYLSRKKMEGSEEID